MRVEEMEKEEAIGREKVVEAIVRREKREEKEAEAEEGSEIPIGKVTEVRGEI